MRVKFNKFERVAGLFVLTAALGAVGVTVGIAVKKGWFASKIKFETTLENADGIHSGTVVQIAGLRAGSVSSIKLEEAQKVRVKFNVLEKFHHRIRKDSQVQVIRPFIIGEKVLDVTVGSDSFAQLEKGSTLPSVKTFDVMDMMSGRTIGPLLGTLEGLLENMKVLADAFSKKERVESFVKVFDRLEPLIKNLDEMSRGVTKMTDVMARERRFEKIAENLTVLTEEFKKLTPAITTIAPELPRASQRAIEALDEAVVTLKAIQKTWFVREHAEKVKKEEQKNRAPAKQKKDD